MRRILKVVELDHSADFVSLVKILQEYQRPGENRAWDTVRIKIPEDLLAIWGEILSECRRNGFIGPWAYGEKIHWRQVLSDNEAQGDLCTMCARECQRREDLNSGEFTKRRGADPNYTEPKPCWVH